MLHPCERKIVIDDKLMRHALRATGSENGNPPPPLQNGMAGRSRCDEDRPLIPVDSSVWIDYSEGFGDLILTGVLQGFSDHKAFNEARKLLTSLTVVQLGGQERFRSIRRPSRPPRCPNPNLNPIWDSYDD
jgi:hypothetical protein